MNKWIVKQLTPEEVYTDRAEFLEYFYEAALKAATRRTMSTVLLGKRRMGKTEIFKRVVNRLFFEQNPKDPKAVVPVYFCFQDNVKSEIEFAKEYLENFMQYYVGFLTSQPHFITDKPRGDTLVSMIENSRSRYPFTRMLNVILQWHHAITVKEMHLAVKDALEIPRRVSDIDDSTIVMFLDEFQNTRLPQCSFDIVGYMQEAVESPTCPHFVTGSAMSILAREIIGRGSLFGRFWEKHAEPLTAYWGAELALKSARYYHADISEQLAPVIADRCGGNPFYITAVIQQSAELKTPLQDENALNKTLAVDITSGFIWGELNDQVTRWITRINEYSITKWVLYLSALDENTNPERRNELNIERIQEQIKLREGKDVPIEKIREVLIHLSRGDLIEYLELGGWFRKVDDPILLDFLKVWGKIEVEGRDRQKIQQDLAIRYEKIERRISEYKGYVAEIHMSQILANLQNKLVSGKYFNSKTDIQMPLRFFYIRHRVRMSSGKGKEIDVIGAGGPDVWVCQSKWVSKPVGPSVLKELLEQAEAVSEDVPHRNIWKWLFAHDGLTKPAQAFAKKHGILWSSRKELDELLIYAGLRKLPELA